MPVKLISLTEKMLGIKDKVGFFRPYFYVMLLLSR